jgi:phosphoserine phosphatase RsbU/P
MMCAPLMGSSGEALGVIQIDTLDQRNRFNRDDLDVLASVACQAGIAVENAGLHEAAVRQQALARELSVAHQVQRGFLPRVAPEIGGYDFFQFYEPAHELGGDYYDYVFLPGGRLGVVLADVSGKGIAASLLMARLSAETRFFLASEPTPGAAMGRLNRVFCDSSWDDRFVTMVVCVLDPARQEMTVVNAGHMAPLLRTASGTVEPVAENETRLPLGVDESTEYPQHTRRLAPGDCFALFTDGITEAMNRKGHLYGQQRLLSCLGRAAAAVADLGPAILGDVKSFVGDRSQSDDMCLVCFGRAASIA